MNVQTINLQQLCDAIMSIWSKISEECFQHLVESMTRRIKTVLKAKGVQPSTSKVCLIKWPVSIYMYIYIYIYIHIYIYIFPRYVLRNIFSSKTCDN